MWGWNNYFQCGETVNGSSFIPQPIRLPMFEDDCVKWKNAACGSVHTLLVTVDGDLYGLGSNMNGQLGLEQ